MFNAIEATTSKFVLSNKDHTIYTVQTYQPQFKTQWDNCITQSKNGTFLFYRDFMEYHQEQFEDASLLILKEGTVVAVFPANRQDDEVHSHQGLTYGGLVIDETVKFNDYIQLFKTLLIALEKESVTQLYIKEIPSFFCILPSEELSYLMFILKAETYRVDLSATIDYKKRLPFSRTRKRGVARAKTAQLTMKEEPVFKAFWNEVLVPNRREKHGVKPTHALEEIQQLHQYFPDQIRQFNVYQEDKIVAGATVFETRTTAHVQYAAANDQRQELGSLDFLFETLIESFAHKDYFNFGISNEAQGIKVNEGLNYWKESFGARSLVHRFYKIKVTNHSLLDNVLI